MLKKLRMVELKYRKYGAVSIRRAHNILKWKPKWILQIQFAESNILIFEITPQLKPMRFGDYPFRSSKTVSIIRIEQADQLIKPHICPPKSYYWKSLFIPDQFRIIFPIFNEGVFFLLTSPFMGDPYFSYFVRSITSALAVE
jgi:hypothetical protein